MSITTIPLLNDLQGVWKGLRIDRFDAGSSTPEPMMLDNLYPFSSVTDLKRQLWIQMDGASRWAPERVFIGVRKDDGTLRPLEFHWPESVGISLPDPLPQEARVPSPGLIDETGNRIPVAPTMLGSLVLEVAMAPEMMGAAPAAPPPTVVAICLSALAPTPTAPLTAALFQGFYQLYYPWLTDVNKVEEEPNTDAAYAATVPYMFDRTGRIEVVQAGLRKNYGGESVALTTMVRLRWVLPPPTSRPDSLERTFYGLRATATMPFLRYFPPMGKGSPILKLGLKEDGSMILDDPKVLAQYLNQSAPNTSGGVIMGRIPLTIQHVERGAAFTLYMFEDGTSDITLEVPQRGMTYIATVAAEAERLLAGVVRDMGFSAEVQPMLRDLHATYNWTHPNPMTAGPISSSTLKSRVAALTPFFDMVPVVIEEQALGVLTWRATSNYESESAQFVFINQMVLKMKAQENPVAMRKAFIMELAKAFGMTQAEAETTLDRWYERRTPAIAPVSGVGAGVLAVPKHSTGVQIVIRGNHPEYRMEIQGVENYMELQRVVSVVGVLLGTPEGELRLRKPADAIVEIAARVEVADAQQVSTAAAMAAGPDETVDVGEANPEDSDLFAEFGFGGDLEGLDEAEPAPQPPPQVSTAVPTATDTADDQPAPNLDAAVAAVGDECRGIPWKADEPPIRIKKEYYITKLLEKDVVMFKQKIPMGETGSKQSYTRSCQAGDGRQPNIMSLAEYARVRRCYEDSVRFVDLPPKSPADLPKFPKYSSAEKIPDSAFMTDPETGKPMWAVLGVKNRTQPGTFNYLMCAELWCDRDNMPLLRSEFESTQGRGFAKPPNTCPFCGGGVVGNLAAPRSGESVIVRKSKEATTKLHIFVGELEHGPRLPCCDTTPRMIRTFLNQAIEGTLTFDGKEVAAETTPATGGVHYNEILGSIQTRYILGGDKTLEAGKIGLLPVYLDAFFGQSGQQAIVKRGAASTKFAEGAIVFVRVGVDKRVHPPQPGLNLFAGLTPLLGFDSAEQTQRHFLTRKMVRAFESANYGTLVQEFAARSTMSDADVTSTLQQFADEYGYTLGANRAHVIRLYKAWLSFLKYIEDKKEPKRLRHIEHLLAQPGVIMAQGLLLVVLERVGESVRVVCPSFGIPPASYFSEVPIAFLWRDTQLDTWEPIVLYNGTKQAVKFFGGRTPELNKLPPQMRDSIQRWINEWRSSSIGCGRPSPPPHVWTPDRDTMGLPRLSTVLLSQSKSGNRVVALVRDRSNRLAGVLMTAQTQGSAATGSVAPPVFFLPTLDDGALADTIPRVYEAESIPPVPLDMYLRFYGEVVTKYKYSALRPEKILARMDSTPPMVVGFKTAAGAMIPVEPTPLPATQTLPIQQVDMFPWERDALILRAPDADARSARVAAIEESTASVEDQMAEAYQHLRVTMAHWLRREPTAASFKDDVAALLRSQLPLYERRKRMDLLLEPLIRTWLEPEQTVVRRSLPLLREDCVAITGETACREAGACRWSGTESRCLIHAPYRNEGTDPVRIFTARMSDELLRYATQRRELYDNSVPMIRTPRGVVRQGVELYIATKPKESVSGLLERLGITSPSAFSFPEEMLRFEGLEEAEPGTGPIQPTQKAPVQMTAPVEQESLPASWSAKTLQVPVYPPDEPNAQFSAWAAGTGKSMADWTRYLGIWRKKIGVPGEPLTRPFEWTVQDFYVISAITLADILFVRQGADGRLMMDRWIATPNTKATTQTAYIILWGPRQLLVTKGASIIYKFTVADLPDDLRELIMTSQPMSEQEARNAVTVSAYQQPTQVQMVSEAEAEQNQNSNGPPPLLRVSDLSSSEPPEPAATQGEGNGGAVPMPQTAPTL